jgi:hypothetical protein
MRDRHHPRVCGSCRAPMARAEDACWRCGTAWVEKGSRAVASTTRTRLRAEHSGRQHESMADSGAVGRLAHAAAGRRGLVDAITAEADVSRAAGAAASVPRRRGPGLVREGSSEPTPLFTRHAGGVIEADRDRRRKLRARGPIAHLGASRERAPGGRHSSRVAAAVTSEARAVVEARLDMDRWVDEGGLVPFEAAAVLRATASTR